MQECVPRHTKLLSTSKQPRDGNKDNGADCCRCYAEQDATAQDVQFRENPSSEECAHQSDQNICNAAKSPAARNFSREPPRNETDEQPSDHGLWNVKLHEM